MIYVRLKSRKDLSPAVSSSRLWREERINVPATWLQCLPVLNVSERCEGGLGRGWLRVVPVENSLEDSRNVVPSGRQRGAGGGIKLA